MPTRIIQLLLTAFLFAGLNSIANEREKDRDDRRELHEPGERDGDKKHCKRGGEGWLLRDDITDGSDRRPACRRGGVWYGLDNVCICRYGLQS